MARAGATDIPREALDELKRHSDPMIGLWATYSLAVLPRRGPDAGPTAELENVAKFGGPAAELAARLLVALRATGEERERRLDEATEWLRRHHRQSAEIWSGWDVSDQGVVRRQAGR